MGSIAAIFSGSFYPVGYCLSHATMYFVTFFIVFVNTQIYLSHSSLSAAKQNGVQ